MIIVTGGAGFIGSCIVRTLNDADRDDIIIVDNVGATDKWLNMRNKRYIKYVHKSKFLDELPSYRNVEAVIHMGAQSSTTERNFDYLWENNFEYTKTLWNYCSVNGVGFIYASSAATYGDGTLGFDDKMNIDQLRPLNGYGYSKQLLDLWVKHQSKKCPPPQHAGLKFFNVYGPNEYFKGSMASMVFHGFNQIKADREIRLFKSCNPQYEDGGQLRDFVYVKDICRVVMWLLQTKTSGLFNVGTGRAQSFRELAEATFYAMGMKPNIRYIDMPEHLKGKYQYYTQAEMSKLREAGYQQPFVDVQKGVADYVQNYLDKDYQIW